MKPLTSAVAGTFTALLLSVTPLFPEESEALSPREPAATEPAATATDDPRDDGGTAQRTESDKGSFQATIVTADRSRKFDSPARALSELQRAAGLKRRAGKDDALSFSAVLEVNGVEYEFSQPDDAGRACRALMDGLRRLARVRAALGDLGTIPDLEPVPAEGPDADGPPGRGQFRGTPEQAALTVRQRVNAALWQEVQRNQGRMPDQQRTQQIIAEQVDRARREGLLSDNAPAESVAPRLPAGAALEARKQAEIEAVREMLARAFSAAGGEDDPAPATVQAGGRK
ncbi:MAG TPA: hypothetical protein VML55_22410 [Planctomycetaceae bacterium]|nr:hypothetical protein [Planctomycetaceae bacterium]